MAGYIENFSRGPVKLRTVPVPKPKKVAKNPGDVWHRRGADGSKVAGNHKKSEVTESPDDYELLFDDRGERIRKYGAKLNQMIKGVSAKTASYDYKLESQRWAEGFKRVGGVWGPKQDAAVAFSIDKNPATREWFDAFKHNFNLPEVDNGIGHPAAVEDQQVAPEPMVARRPEDTPTRPPVSPKRRRLNTPETQGAAPPTEPVAPAETQEEAPVPIEVDPIEPAVAAVEGTPAMAAGGAVGVDPSGGLPFEPIISHFPMHTNEGGTERFTFGGSRIMYTWAYDFGLGQIPALYQLPGDKLDGAIVGHQLPWEWIPFYCTPAEFNMLPYRHADIYVDQVRVRVTPMAKETQFETASTTATVASQEHLALGKVCVGLNHKWNSVLSATAAEVVAPAVNSMAYSTDSLTAVNFTKLRKKFWGNLSDWTADVSPYPDTGFAKSSSHLGIRELENVQVMLWDRWETGATKQGDNTFCWGAFLRS